MTSLNVKTEYSEYKDCKLRVGKYVENNSVGSIAETVFLTCV